MVPAGHRRDGQAEGTGIGRVQPVSGICAERTVIVTGGGGGLGRSYSRALAAAGANVVVNDINPETAGATVEHITAAGGRALVNTNDITDHEDAGRIVQQALDAYGDCHAVVNNAGICRDRMFASMSPDDWDQVIAVHLKGHFCIANHLAPLLAATGEGRPGPLGTHHQHEFRPRGCWGPWANPTTRRPRRAFSASRWCRRRNSAATA